MKKITILAGEGSLLSGIAGMIDALAIANLWHRALDKDVAQPLFQTEIVGVDDKPLPAYGGFPIHPDRKIDDVDRTDAVLISPYLPKIGPTPRGLDQMLAWIDGQHSRRTLIGSICTGAFILAETGLLDGRLATTNWQYAKMFMRRFPKVLLKPDRLLTEDSGLVCTGASTASYYLALYLIERFGSTELAAVCAKALLVDPNRKSQTPYIVHDTDFGDDHQDREIKTAETWMRLHYSEKVSIDDVARQVGISPRHFKRRFKNALGESPLNYLQKVRVEAAKKKLETTRETVNEIAWQTGYEDSSAFRRVFKKYTDVSPKDYRSRFSREP